MLLRDILTLKIKEKKRKERVKAVRKLAAGMGTVGAITAVGVVAGLLLAPKAEKETREDMASLHEIKQEIQKTAENISNDLK